MDFHAFSYGGGVNPSTADMTIMKLTQPHLLLISQHLDIASTTLSPSFGGRVYRPNSQCLLIESTTFLGKHRRGYWETVFDITPLKGWLLEKDVKEIIQKLLIITPHMLPTQTQLYKDTEATLWNIRSALRERSPNNLAVFSRIRIPDPATLEAIRLYGSSEAGLGSMPPQISTLLRETGLVWLCVSPERRRIPPFWVDYYNYFVAGRCENRYSGIAEDRRIWQLAFRDSDIEQGGKNNEELTGNIRREYPSANPTSQKNNQKRAMEIAKMLDGEGHRGIELGTKNHQTDSIRQGRRECKEIRQIAKDIPKEGIATFMKSSKFVTQTDSNTRGKLEAIAEHMKKQEEIINSLQKSNDLLKHKTENLETEAAETSKSIDTRIADAVETAVQLAMTKQAPNAARNSTLKMPSRLSHQSSTSDVDDTSQQNNLLSNGGHQRTNTLAPKARVSGIIPSAATTSTITRGETMPTTSKRSLERIETAQDARTSGSNRTKKVRTANIENESD